MPCDSVVRIELSMENWDIDVLKKALEAEGISATMRGEFLYWSGNTFEAKTKKIISQQQNAIDQAKTAYSNQLQRQNMQKWKNLGWQVTEVKQNG